MIAKRTGDKGPYQLFTVNRSAPINTGHYATVDKWDLSPDFPSKDFPDSISLARQLEQNKKQGAFGKLDRFQKKPTDRIAMDHPGKVISSRSTTAHLPSGRSSTEKCRFSWTRPVCDNSTLGTI